MSDTEFDASEARQAFARQFPTPSLAFSIDGVRASFAAPLDSGLVLGAFAVVETADGPVFGQVDGLDVDEREVAELDLDYHRRLGGMEVTSARARPVIPSLSGAMSILGHFAGDGFVVGDTSAFQESPIRRSTSHETASALTGLDADSSTLAVGHLAERPEVVARLRATGFARHTFLCGQSGSGKTYTTGVLLERLRLETDLPLVILDPNSDHVGLGDAHPDARGELAERYRHLPGRLVVAAGRERDADSLLAVHFSDLSSRAQAQLLRLDPIADLESYATLRSVCDALPKPFSIGAVIDAARVADGAGARLALRIGNLGLEDWGLWCRSGESSLVDVDLDDNASLVVDLGSLAGPDERTIVAYAVLARLWDRRRERRPRLVVIDEAHNVVPAETTDPLMASTADLGVLIAGEGRKFGLHLLVATQRPDKVHPNVVSQCDNLVLLRMNSRLDVDTLTRVFSHIPEPLIRLAPSFGLGNVLFGGPIAPVPVVGRIDARLTPEGGADVSTSWARPER